MIKLLSTGLAALLLVGCASRPINPPISSTIRENGYQFETVHSRATDQENLVVLAFSGGGTRAAAFSYGVLEFLRKTHLTGPRGDKIRLLDEVDVITGVSGGSFTALSKYFAYFSVAFVHFSILPIASASGSKSSMFLEIKSSIFSSISSGSL